MESSCPPRAARLKRMASLSTLNLQGVPVDAARLSEICRRYGVAELSVFGSFAREEAGSDSDVDLLFELTPDARLGFGLFDLEAELVELFGRPVDLLSKDSIHRLVRDTVLAEARVLYAA